MKTSARNQLSGNIVAITQGKVNSEVSLDINGTTLKAVITNDALIDMGLTVGNSVVAIVKASAMIVSKERPGKISARNILETTVNEVIDGAVNCELKLTMGNTSLTAIITEDAAKELSITTGETLYTIIKANSIILAI